MEDEFAKIISEALSMQSLSLPRTNVAPLDVQSMRDGRPFGRFALKDVFEGEFSGIGTKPSADVAALNRVTSTDYDVSGRAAVSGLPAAVGRAKGALGGVDS